MTRGKKRSAAREGERVMDRNVDKIRDITTDIDRNVYPVGHKITTKIHLGTCPADMANIRHYAGKMDAENEQLRAQVEEFGREVDYWRSCVEDLSPVKGN